MIAVQPEPAGRSWSKPSGLEMEFFHIFFMQKPVVSRKETSPLEDSLNKIYGHIPSIKWEIHIVVHNSPTMGTHRGMEKLAAFFFGEERSCRLGRFGTSSLWQLRGELRVFSKISSRALELRIFVV